MLGLSIQLPRCVAVRCDALRQQQEDLEEFEVREGMAMHEAEEKAQRLSSSSSLPEGESKVSALLQTAVEGSLTTTFTGEAREARL